MHDSKVHGLWLIIILTTYNIVIIASKVLSLNEGIFSGLLTSVQSMLQFLYTHALRRNHKGIGTII